MSITEAAGGRRTAKADAMKFLQGALAGAPVPAAELSRVAHERGLTPKAIRSAREALGVEIARNGFGPGSKSLMVAAEGAHRCPPCFLRRGPSPENHRRPRSDQAGALRSLYLLWRT